MEFSNYNFCHLLHVPIPIYLISMVHRMFLMPAFDIRINIDKSLCRHYIPAFKFFSFFFSKRERESGSESERKHTFSCKMHIGPGFGRRNNRNNFVDDCDGNVATTWLASPRYPILCALQFSSIHHFIVHFRADSIPCTLAFCRWANVNHFIDDKTYQKAICTLRSTVIIPKRRADHTRKIASL